MAEDQKTLLERILSDDRQDRVSAVVDLLFQAESYAKTSALAIGGLGIRLAHQEEAQRDAFAVGTIANDFAAWLKQQREALAGYPMQTRTEKAKAVDLANLH